MDRNGLPDDFTAETLRNLTLRDRTRAVQAIKMSKVLDPAEKAKRIAALEASGPVMAPALKSDDPATVAMYEIINCSEGKAACIAAAEAGLPALSAVERKIYERLGELYPNTVNATVEAGGLVGRLLRDCGYEVAGRRQMPAGSIAKTAAIWRRAIA